MKGMMLLSVLLSSTVALAACNQTAAPAAAPATAASNTTQNAAAPATDKDEAGAEVREAAVAAPAATVSADATNQNFRLNNRSQDTVTHVYVSRVSDNEWGADVLGSQVIPAGENAQITFPRGESECNWDVRVTVNNETNHELRNLNLCQTSEVNYD